ncbi:MAG: PKD domain-containing protein, partial [Putridiphycobacter sp.]|nr:PKD domain-containing protein [Putridiphycobacter sp.]
ISNDRAKFVIVNAANEVFVGGSTTGLYPLTAGVFSSQSQNNLFVHKMNGTLTNTIFSTAVGCFNTQQPEIFMTAMGLDYCEKIYFTGASTGNNFPTTADAYETAEKGLYMCVLEPNAVALHYGTYFGGNVNGQHFHPGSKSKYNNEGILFHTECTQSVNYPIVGGVNTQNGGNYDGASFIFDFEFDQPLTQTNIPDPSGCTFPVTLSAVHPDNNNVSYLWSTGATTPTIDVNANGMYKVLIYNFCDTIRDSVDVNLSGVDVAFTVNESNACAGTVFQFTDLSIDVPAGATYTWDFGDGGISNDQNPLYTYRTPGQFTVSLEIKGNNCTSSEVKIDTITINPKPNADFSYSPEIIDVEDPTTQFINRSSSDVTSLIWYFFVNGQTSVNQNPVFTFPNTDGGFYPVELTVENAFGCQDTSRQTITVQDIITLYVPNSFTPEESTTNSVFQPVITSGVDPYNFRLLIFNRWGDIVFESRDYTKSWDGKFNNEIVEQGAYVWQIDFKETMSSKEHVYRGHVTVLR